MPENAKGRMPVGRRFVPTNPGAVSRLRKDRVWPEVERRLKAGEGLTAIARWLHEHGKATETKLNSLVERLREVRTRMAVSQVLPPSQLPEFVRRAQKEAKDVNRLLAQLYRLRHTQARRIREGRQLEAQTKIPVSQVSRDIELATKIEEAIVHLSMELGLTKRAPTQVHAMHLGVLGIVQRLGADSRERVRRAVGDVLKHLQALPPPGPDGSQVAPGESPPEEEPRELTPLEALKEENRQAAQEAMKGRGPKGEKRAGEGEVEVEGQRAGEPGRSGEDGGVGAETKS